MIEFHEPICCRSLFKPTENISENVFSQKGRGLTFSYLTIRVVIKDFFYKRKGWTKGWIVARGHSLTKTFCKKDKN